MKSFTVNKNDAGQRLDKFITKSVPLLPKTLLYKYIRIKRIKINGKRAEISTKLQEGDVIDMYINDEFFEAAPEKYDFLKASKNLNIVYEDENIILCDKKAGVLCHPDDKEFTDTLINRIKRYLYEKGEFKPDEESSFVPALVNRIDRNTGGIVIAAKNAETLRILNQKMKDRELHKFYLCIVHGTPKLKSGLLEGYLLKDEDKNIVKISKNRLADSKEIRTKYSVLDSKNGLSLIEVELLTGRTHQIRAHFASIGHPLLGDGKYGTNSQNKKYGYKKQCLYSYKLVFDFTSDAGPLEYLNGQEFAVKDIWFKDAFYNNEL
ncbi:MAG: RluA family pseudouridine synthase [Oscillospiraceae bacterium]|nr:RluA family pseudouridine synthase [Oscillospiraceae bacterium]